MDYRSFSPLYVGKLTISAIYSLIKSTLELVKPVVKELGPVALAALAQLETAQEELGSGMNKSQKSALTPEVRALDKERDTDVAEIFRVTRTYLPSKDENKKAAASTLQLFLAPYQGVARQPINIETGSITDLIAKYKAQPALVAAATLLGIDSLFTHMETKNNELNQIYHNRNTEYTERETAASDMKPAAVTNYIQFCTTVEQAHNYTPSDTITALFNKMDELRKVYHALEGSKDTSPTAVTAK
jgi:hypothetical protein